MSRNLHDMPVSQVEWEAMQAEVMRENFSGAQAAAFIILSAVAGLAFVCGFVAAILVL